MNFRRPDKGFYENVVEACAPEAGLRTTPSPIPHHPAYVNIVQDTPRWNLDSEDEDGVPNDLGKIKIDGSSITFVGFVNLTSVSIFLQNKN